MSEGSVTTPLRFDDEDLVRGLRDTVDAENEAYDSSSLRRRDRSSSSAAAPVGRVVDFCFMSPSSLASGGGGFSAASILVLCGDGSVYGASPIMFDGTVLPRAVVVESTSILDAEIDASMSFLQTSSSSSPAPTPEHEVAEARLRQCRAARRYLLDAFGMPDIPGPPSRDHPGPAANRGGSYYVSASVVHSRSYSSADGGGYSQALAWQPRLQGPLILPPQSDEDPADSPSALPPYVCIESFGGAAGAGIVDGFVVARHCGADRRHPSTSSSSSPIHVEFGILPGEGAVLLPRFDFESDADCQLIDELVRGTGMYVEHATITQDKSSSEVGDESGGTPPPSRALVVRGASSIGRHCSIVLDPLDDAMIHVINCSQIVTVTTNAVAVTAKCFASRVDESAASIGRGEKEGMSSIRTKAWSGLEVNSSGTALVGARVSADVHLGHVLYARLSDGKCDPFECTVQSLFLTQFPPLCILLSGSIEVVNITATHCLYETSEQMKAKSEQNHASQFDDKALEALENVQPLHEILQPLIDKVCDGLSKMGKIVGGATLPKDAGPENLAVFLETQHSCEVNVLMPMEEISKVLNARRELLKEMYDHQAAELIRLSELLVAFKHVYGSNLERVLQLEANASILANRSSAVLIATRDLRPQITDAEAAYFKDLQRYETSCSKWEGTVDQLQKDAFSSCDAMSAGAIENGDVQCLVDLPPQKIEICQKLLRGEGQLLKKLEKNVRESSDTVDQLSKMISGHSSDSARLKLQ